MKKIQKDGFVRVRINGEMHEITDDVDLDKNKSTRLSCGGSDYGKNRSESRLADSTEIALNLADGLVVVSLWMARICFSVRNLHVLIAALVLRK